MMPFMMNVAAAALLLAACQTARARDVYVDISADRTMADYRAEARDECGGPLAWGKPRVTGPIDGDEQWSVVFRCARR